MLIGVTSEFALGIAVGHRSVALRGYVRKKTQREGVLRPTTDASSKYRSMWAWGYCDFCRRLRAYSVRPEFLQEKDDYLQG